MPRNNRDFQNRERWLRQQDEGNWGTRRQRRDFERRMRHATPEQRRAAETLEARAPIEFDGLPVEAAMTVDFDEVTRAGIETTWRDAVRAWQERFATYAETILPRDTYVTAWDEDLMRKNLRPYMPEEPEKFNAANYVISVLAPDERNYCNFKAKIASADNANNIFITTDWWNRMANVGDITIGDRVQFVAPNFVI